MRITESRSGGSDTPPPSLLTRPFLLVTTATFAYFVSVGMLLPTLPLYVEEILGGSDLAIGITVGAFGFTALLLRPWVGRSGDRSGRRRLLVGGALVVGATVLAYPLAGSVPVLVALRLLTGAGEAAFFVSAATVITDLAPGPRRGEAMSLFSVALYGGIAVGPVVGESLLHAAGYGPLWFASAGACVVAAAIGIPVPETRPDRPLDARPPPLVHPAALLPGTILLTSILGFAGFAAFVPLYVREIGMSGSRGVFLAYSVVLLAIRGLGARIPDRVGPARTALVALISTAGGLTVVAFWPDPVGLYTGTILFAVGQALAFPALVSLALHRAPDTERGAVMGTQTAFVDLAFAAGGLSLGAVAERFGYDGAFLVAAAVALVGLVLLVATRARLTRPLPEAASSDVTDTRTSERPGDVP